MIDVENITKTQPKERQTDLAVEGTEGKISEATPKIENNLMEEEGVYIEENAKSETIPTDTIHVEETVISEMEGLETPQEGGKEEKDQVSNNTSDLEIPEVDQTDNQKEDTLSSVATVEILKEKDLVSMPEKEDIIDDIHITTTPQKQETSKSSQDEPETTTIIQETRKGPKVSEEPTLSFEVVTTVQDIEKTSQEASTPEVVKMPKDEMDQPQETRSEPSEQKVVKPVEAEPGQVTSEMEVLITTKYGKDKREAETALPDKELVDELDKSEDPALSFEVVATAISVFTNEPSTPQEEQVETKTEMRPPIKDLDTKMPEKAELPGDEDRTSVTKSENDKMTKPSWSQVGSKTYAETSLIENMGKEPCSEPQNTEKTGVSEKTKDKPTLKRIKSVEISRSKEKEISLTRAGSLDVKEPRKTVSKAEIDKVTQAKTKPKGLKLPSSKSKIEIPAPKTEKLTPDDTSDKIAVENESKLLISESQEPLSMEENCITQDILVDELAKEETCSTEPVTKDSDTKEKEEKSVENKAIKLSEKVKPQPSLRKTKSFDISKPKETQMARASSIDVQEIQPRKAFPRVESDKVPESTTKTKSLKSPKSEETTKNVAMISEATAPPSKTPDGDMIRASSAVTEPKVLPDDVSPTLDDEELKTELDHIESSVESPATTEDAKQTIKASGKEKAKPILKKAQSVTISEPKEVRIARSGSLDVKEMQLRRPNSKVEVSQPKIKPKAPKLTSLKSKEIAKKTSESTIQLADFGKESELKSPNAVTELEKLESQDFTSISGTDISLELPKEEQEEEKGEAVDMKQLLVAPSSTKNAVAIETSKLEIPEEKHTPSLRKAKSIDTDKPKEMFPVRAASIDLQDIKRRKDKVETGKPLKTKEKTPKLSTSKIKDSSEDTVLISDTETAFDPDLPELSPTNYKKNSAELEKTQIQKPDSDSADFALSSKLPEEKYKLSPTDITLEIKPKVGIEETSIPETNVEQPKEIQKSVVGSKAAAAKEGKAKPSMKKAKSVDMPKPKDTCISRTGSIDVKDIQQKTSISTIDSGKPEETKMDTNISSKDSIDLSKTAKLEMPDTVAEIIEETDAKLQSDNQNDAPQVEEIDEEIEILEISQTNPNLEEFEQPPVITTKMVSESQKGDKEPIIDDSVELKLRVEGGIQREEEINTNDVINKPDHELMSSDEDVEELMDSLSDSKVTRTKKKKRSKKCKKEDSGVENEPVNIQPNPPDLNEMLTIDVKTQVEFELEVLKKEDRITESKRRPKSEGKVNVSEELDIISEVGEPKIERLFRKDKLSPKSKTRLNVSPELPENETNDETHKVNLILKTVASTVAQLVTSEEKDNTTVLPKPEPTIDIQQNPKAKTWEADDIKFLEEKIEKSQSQQGGEMTTMAPQVVQPPQGEKTPRKNSKDSEFTQVEDIPVDNVAESDEPRSRPVEHEGIIKTTEPWDESETSKTKQKKKTRKPKRTSKDKGHEEEEVPSHFQEMTKLIQQIEKEKETPLETPKDSVLIEPQEPTLVVCEIQSAVPHAEMYSNLPSPKESLEITLAEETPVVDVTESDEPRSPTAERELPSEEGQMKTTETLSETGVSKTKEKKKTKKPKKTSKDKGRGEEEAPSDFQEVKPDSTEPQGV
ncbi:titin-like [Boleophthalmus pectinirostris]|uniref:titin-like n=1 Tax=Boleophthalmus pectinirostris TaxID=150288 RepID=UPI00242D5C3D|nr:titin-like [Boleophthalmus pectinirostris]